MKKFQRTAAIAGVGIVLFFAVLGWAGDYDYCEQIILHMSQEQYDSVKRLLTDSNGCEPSDRDIAHYWAEAHGE